MLCKKCKKEISEGSTFCNWCGAQQTSVKRKALKRPNGSGCIYKLSGRRRKPWAVVITDANLYRRLLGTFETRTEALALLDKYQVAGMPTDWGLTVSDVYARWSESHYQRLTPAGIGGYMDAWKRFKVYGNKKMRELKAAHIQQLIDEATVKSKTGEERPLSRSGKEKIRLLASQLCQWAIQQDIIDKNYAEFVKINAPGPKEKEIYSAEEISLLKAAREDKNVQIILVLIYSGMRINELFGMRLDDVHLPTHMIGGEKTEAGKGRAIPIHPEILPIIRQWMENAVCGQEWLLTNSSGHKINDDNWRSRGYYPTLERIGIRKMSPHSTRHTFATLMRQAKVREEIIARIMGHSKFATTAGIYIHTDTEELCDAVKTI